MQFLGHGTAIATAIKTDPVYLVSLIEAHRIEMI